MKHLLALVVFGLIATGIFFWTQTKYRQEIGLIPKSELKIKVGPNLELCNVVVTGMPNVDPEHYGPWATTKELQLAQKIIVIPESDKIVLLITNQDEEKRQSAIKYSWRNNFYFTPVFTVNGQYIEVEYWHTDYGILYLGLLCACVLTVFFRPLYYFFTGKAPIPYRYSNHG
jgi:hypothetical protein